MTNQKKRDVTITLSEPVIWEGKEITSILMKRPKVKDLKRMSAIMNDGEDALEQGILLAAAMINMPTEFIEELDPDDFTAISEVVADFFPQGTASPNGEASLPKPPTG